MKRISELSFLTYYSSFFGPALTASPVAPIGLPHPLAAFRSFSVSGSYNVKFGPGIRHDLQGRYRNIQEREGIITSLLPEDQAAREADHRTAMLACNRKVFTAFRRELRKAGLSPQTVEEHVATIADFASLILLESDPPRGVLDLTLADIESYVREKPGKQPLTSFKRFVRFLLSTGRIDYETGENVYGPLKQVSKGK